jgi:hypothetical protein
VLFSALGFSNFALCLFGVPKAGRPFSAIRLVGQSSAKPVKLVNQLHLCQKRQLLVFRIRNHLRRKTTSFGDHMTPMLVTAMPAVSTAQTALANIEDGIGVWPDVLVYAEHRLSHIAAL